MEKLREEFCQGDMEHLTKSAYMRKVFIETTSIAQLGEDYYSDS